MASTSKTISMTFSKIMELLAADPLTTQRIEEKLFKLPLYSEAFKQHVKKKLKWIIFQYERNIFMNKEMIEFMKYGSRSQLQLLAKLLAQIGVNPIKRSWIMAIENYKPDGPITPKFPDIGKMIAKNFFSIIKIRETLDERRFEFNNSNVNIKRPKIKNLFTVAKDAIELYKMHKKPIFNIVHKNGDKLKLVNTVEVCQGTSLHKQSPVPKFFDKDRAARSLLNCVTTHNYPYPIFNEDNWISITNKFYFSNEFSRDKISMDPPDIVVLNNMQIDDELNIILNGLRYNIISVGDNAFIISQRIKLDRINRTIGELLLGRDLNLENNTITLPQHWKIIKMVKNGYIIVAQDVTYDKCRSKFKNVYEKETWIESLPNSYKI